MCDINRNMGNQLSGDSMNVIASFFEPEKLIPMALMLSRTSKSMQSDLVSRIKFTDKELLPFLDVFVSFMFLGKYESKPCLIWNMHDVMDLWYNDCLFREMVLNLDWVRMYFQKQHIELIESAQLSSMASVVFMQHSVLKYDASNLHMKNFMFTDLPPNIQKILLSNEGKYVVRKYLLSRHIDRGKMSSERHRQHVLNMMQFTKLHDLKTFANKEKIPHLFMYSSPYKYLTIVKKVFNVRYYYKLAGHTDKRNIENHDLESLEFWKHLAHEYKEEVLHIMRRKQYLIISKENTNNKRFVTLKQCKDEAVRAWKGGSSIRHVIRGMIKAEFTINRARKKQKVDV